MQPQAPPMQCTFVSRDKMINGKYYKCKTCPGLPPNHSICPACAAVCHYGHQLVEYSGSYYCDCGAHEPGFYCRLVQPQGPQCTFVGKPIIGCYYQCKSCPGLPPNHAICPSCAAVCHYGHQLVQLSGTYSCDCGGHKPGFWCRLK